MNEHDKAWRKWSEARADEGDDETDPVSFDAGYDIGHAAAEAKYAPALSAAEAERDLARGNELAIAAISAAHRIYRSNGDLHELARAVGQILNGPGEADG